MYWRLQERIPGHPLPHPLHCPEHTDGPVKPSLVCSVLVCGETGGLHARLMCPAGRMQDNEPLMRALSNLIVVNSPDLVLFVGEALVGNDAVDQLTKFNQRLADLAQDAATAHTIDGILLTKFDTIDDKVH